MKTTTSQSMFVTETKVSFIFGCSTLPWVSRMAEVYLELNNYLLFSLRDHSFCTYAEFYEKLTFRIHNDS